MKYIIYITTYNMITLITHNYIYIYTYIYIYIYIYVYILYDNYDK